MRELTHDEIEQVSGGVLPALGLAKAAVDLFAARTLTSFIVSRVSFVSASIGFGQSMVEENGS